jgi:ribosomal-protein-alanine N-acetyltransferase
MAAKGKSGPGAGLELVPAEPGFLKDMLESRHLSGFLRAAAEQTLTHQAETGAPAPWTGYFARQGSEWVGICAFVDRPSGGEVEIAYGTAPGFEGSGIATAMALWLVERAFQEAEVTAVVANTAPEPNASTRILETLGFRRDGVIQDAGIGEAWHWRKPRGY